MLFHGGQRWFLFLNWFDGGDGDDDDDYSRRNFILTRNERHCSTPSGQKKLI